MTWLLRLYPRAWRQRYGEEMTHVLAQQHTTPRTVLDLIAGAVDARLNPQWTPRLEAAHRQGGLTMASFFAHCQPQGVSTEEHRRSVMIMLSATAALTGVYLLLIWLGRRSPAVDAFGVALYPWALILSMRASYLKRYSRAAAATIMVASAIAVFAIALGATIMANLL